MRCSASRGRRMAALLAVAAVVFALPVLTATSATADTAPPAATTPTTVSSDLLPTVQIDGVVWAHLVVGNRVYVTGQFTQARPAGAAVGTNQTPRANILAFDITTGALITSWAPTLNAQGRALAASADGQTIFVSGSFTQVNGVARNRVAALDANTGALRAIAVRGTDARVSTIAVSGDTLYLGGIFNTAGNQPRTRLAAYSIATGELLPWAPTANAEVMAMTAPPGGPLVVGGRFTTLNGENNYGLGALSPTTGATQTFAANAIVRNAGESAAIYSLSNNGGTVFGTGYTFGSGGNLENTFSANAANGALTWVSGCLGDTYAAAPIGDALYMVGHPHNCAQIGYFPEQSPRNWQRAMAYRTGPAPDGRLNVSGSFNGRPAPEVLHWQPTLNAGDFTGQSQAAWTAGGNDQYLVLGGEFPSVNGTPQQGLARFAVRSIAPNTDGAQGIGTLAPTMTSIGAGAMRATWTASYDRDNIRSTYELLRGAQLSTAAVVATTTAESAWFSRPTLALTDATAPPGTSQSYRIRVRDPLGNVAVGPTVVASVPAGTLPASTYRSAVLADAPTHYWRLGEAGGNVGLNWAGNRDLTLAGGATRGTVGALSGDADPATTFPGSATTPASTTGTAESGPQTFTVEAWVRTTTTRGGKIIGFGNRNNAASTTYDRHLYMTNGGQIVFGVSPGTVRTVASTAAFNNGQWHHVVGTLSGAGLRLYVDGQLVGERADTTSAQAYTGYWRVAGDTVGTTWPNRPTSAALAGAVDEVAVYPSALSPAQILAHAQLGQGITPNQAPTAAFTETVTDLTVSFDGSGSTDPDGTVASYAWNFGDGQTGTGPTAQHVYGAAGTYTATLTVTDNQGATGTTSHPVTTTPVNQPPTAAFTQSVTNLTAAFDGSGSTDPDGTIASYAWNFGDGQTGTGVTAQRVYGAAGTYTVTLTVTDNRGGTATTSRSVVVTDPPANTTVAADAFARTVASGFGTADTGGAWTVAGSGGTASVNGGSGQLTVGAGKTLTLRLPAVNNRDNDVVHTVGLDQVPTGGGATLSTTVRSTAAGDYRARVKILATGEVQVSLTRVNGTTETSLTTALVVPGLTYAPGQRLQVRAQATGASPTTVQMKVWPAGSPEPAAWQRTATDSTAGLQEAGAVGLVTYLSGSATASTVTRYDDLVVVRP